MKYLLSFCFVLMMTAQLGAETYSWVDDNGTYNFTEDLSSVPKKYRKNVKRLGEIGSDSDSQAPPAKEKKPATAEFPAINKPVASEAPAVKPASAPVEDKQLYNGKSYADWRKEFDAHEAELERLEQQLKFLQKEFVKQPELTIEQFTAIKKDYDEAREAYKQKYKIYSDLMDAARKAGITVEMKK